jgi:hypothetical protein
VGRPYPRVTKVGRNHIDPIICRVGLEWLVKIRLVFLSQIQTLIAAPAVSVGRIRVLVKVGIANILGVGKINQERINPPVIDRTVSGIIALQENWAESLKLKRLLPDGGVTIL